MPARCLEVDEKDFFAQRYQQIVNFEDHLYQNGYRLVKLFLNLSPEEQKKRFLAHMDTPEKNWKFSAGDLNESDLWPQCMDALDATMEQGSFKLLSLREHAPCASNGQPRKP